VLEEGSSRLAEVKPPPPRPVLAGRVACARGAGASAVQALKVSKEPPAGLKGCGRWVGMGHGKTDDSDFLWLEAVERTHVREKQLRAEEQEALEEAGRRATLEEQARLEAEEARRLQAERQRQRVEALVLARAAKRQHALAEAASKKSDEAEAFLAAVVVRKQQERELRSMALEERAWRQELFRRTANAELLTQRAGQELVLQAACRAEADEAARRQAAEEEAAAAARAADLLCWERQAMEDADLDSRDAAAAAQDAAWSESVRCSKVDLREERARSSRESTAMACEDASSQALRGHEWRKQFVQLSVRAVLEAASTAVLQRLAARAEQQEQLCRAAAALQLKEERVALEREDQLSHLREARDAQSRADDDWRKVVVERKSAEQSLRASEAAESAAMAQEDSRARQARSCEGGLRQQQQQQLQAKLYSEASADARSFLATCCQGVIQRLLAEADALKEHEELAASAALATELQAMRHQEALSRAKLEREAEEQARRQEQELCRLRAQQVEAQKEEQRRLRLQLEMDREFRLRKAQHVRSKDETAVQQVQEAAAERRRRLRAEQLEAEVAALSDLQHGQAEARQRAAEAESLRRAAGALAEDRRRALAEARQQEQLLAAEAKAFEELYRQNRSLVSAARQRELAVAEEGRESPAANSLGPTRGAYASQAQHMDTHGVQGASPSRSSAETAGPSGRQGPIVDVSQEVTKVPQVSSSPLAEGSERLRGNAGALLAFAQTFSASYGAVPSSPSSGNMLEGRGTSLADDDSVSQLFGGRGTFFTDANFDP
ncbi:unnamed protein product, partial [Polarella glacialis]